MDIEIAGGVAAILVIKGAGMAFAAGILLFALLYAKDFFKGKNDKTFTDHGEEEESKAS
ncbi:hypothetical protein [Peribacillus frigoritolerans]|uniref:hypothetical protein n=1 Tax=Peribacillus frigoritolerans TaxID=450367 RepID=UPI00207A3CB1|nr:hypothetical protein [Peribacillus frigoritolerans]USK73114.1 hypothetical protein LIT31_14740 [Peribacillus frigoritolerans]